MNLEVGQLLKPVFDTRLKLPGLHFVLTFRDLVKINGEMEKRERPIKVERVLRCFVFTFLGVFEQDWKIQSGCHGLMWFGVI